MMSLIEKVKNAKSQFLLNKQLFSHHDNETTKRKLRKKINTLENKLSTLENAIKENLFNELMIKLNEPEDIKVLMEENKKLRAKNKSLKIRLYELETNDVKTSKSVKQ